MEYSKHFMKPILLGEITRLLRTVRNLEGRVYVVGGLVTEGQSVRDIDIVISDKKDIPIINKALGKYAKVAHYLLQEKEPPATLFVKVKGVEGTSPDKTRLKKGQRFPKNEYAN